jgi:hypothetical protein
MASMAVPITCDDLRHVIAEMRDALPLYGIVDDPAGFIRKELEAAEQRCQAGENLATVTLTGDLASQLEQRLRARAALRSADPTMRERRDALLRTAALLRHTM